MAYRQRIFTKDALDGISRATTHTHAIVYRKSITARRRRADLTQPIPPNSGRPFSSLVFVFDVIDHCLTRPVQLGAARLRIL